MAVEMPSRLKKTWKRKVFDSILEVFQIQHLDFFFKACVTLKGLNTAVHQ